MDKILIAAAAFYAGYYLAKRPATDTAAVGESWFCKANPKDWRCNPTTRIRVVLAPTTATKAIGAPYNPDTGYSPNYATGGFPYSV